MVVRHNVSLKDLTNFKIGGPADYLCEVKNIDDIKNALQLARDNKAPFFVLAGGTNVLISDAGFPGVVIKPEVDFINRENNKVTVGSGTAVSKLLNFCSKEGLSGLEWAGGLPGTIGGAIRGNAGCFGGEIRDVVEEVVSFDTVRGEAIRRSSSACAFSYRNSVFKSSSGHEIIIEAILALEDGDREAIAKTIKEKIDYRASRHPLEYPSAGSVFKNVDVRLAPPEVVKTASAVIKVDPFPVIPAAYLIAGAGLKGKTVGGAMVSDKHSNFIVNTGSATAEDVRNLIKIVKREVVRRFGVELEEEILIL